MLRASAIPGSLAMSATDLGPIFAHLVAALRRGETILLLADFDGTLVPIVRDPTDAWLPSEVRNDELAFLALRADALTVKVGGHESSYAAYRVRDVADVHCLLSALAAEVRWRIEA
jgi:hypothetical protein